MMDRHVTKLEIRKRAIRQQPYLNKGFDEQYFKKVDSSDKAYWLGYLFNVSYMFEDGFFLFSRRQSNHFDALMDFCKDTGLTTDLFRYSDTRSQKKLNSLTYNVAFTSKEFVQGFKGYFPGGTSFETKEANYPNISPEFNRDFIRGLFDSGSSVFQSSKGKRMAPHIWIDGSYEMLRKIQQILIEEVDVTSHIGERGATNRQPHAMKLSSIKKLPDFILYLYDNATHYNTHKYQQLIELFDDMYD